MNLEKNNYNHYDVLLFHISPAQPVIFACIVLDSTNINAITSPPPDATLSFWYLEWRARAIASSQPVIPTVQTHQSTTTKTMTTTWKTVIFFSFQPRSILSIKKCAKEIFFDANILCWPTCLTSFKLHNKFERVFKNSAIIILELVKYWAFFNLSQPVQSNNVGILWL